MNPYFGNGEGRRGEEEREAVWARILDKQTQTQDEQCTIQDWSSDAWQEDNSWAEGAWQSEPWQNENSEWYADSWHKSQTGNKNDLESMGGLGMCELNLDAVGAIESVRTDTRGRSISFGVDTAASQTIVSSTHPAVRGY